MEAEENKERFRIFFEYVLNNRNPQAAAEFVSSDYIDHSSPPGFPQGPDSFQRGFAYLLSAFPDYHSTLRQLVAEGDRVVYYETWEGTHQGDFMGMPPTNRKVAVSVIGILRMAGGKIVERWAVADQLALLQQLSASPGSTPV